MALERPKDPKELRYFSRKTVGSGKAMIWVYNPICPKCKTGCISIPYDEEKGRYKSRAKTVKCNKCDFEMDKKDFKESEAIANVAYTCPHCNKEGELQTPFKKNSKKEFIFVCGSCGQKIVAK